MRDILFKGKRIDTGQWIEGYLFFSWERAYILWGTTNGMPDMIEVDSSVICQYTGLTDKNGRKIFEGDIIEFDDTGEEGYEYKEGFDFRNRAVIVWNNGRFELDKPMSDNSEVLDFMNNCHEDFWDALKSCEVIGNTFDNPNLLKGGDDT